MKKALKQKILCNFLVPIKLQENLATKSGKLLKTLNSKLDKNNIPKHVAIIMDGNGRWARQRHLPRTAGHREGINRVREIVKEAQDLGVKVLTLFTFSTENWDRPKSEIDTLMRHLSNFLNKEIISLQKNNIRFMVIGRGKPIPNYMQDKIRAAEKKTETNTGLTLVFALNYGSRQEIVDAAKRFAGSVLKGVLSIDDLDADKFSSYFYTAGLPDPDLLIRTSGEMRISNFLLWQLSYAEFVFVKKHWPQFRRSDFQEAIIEYQKRERRFGRLK